MMRCPRNAPAELLLFMMRGQRIGLGCGLFSDRAMRTSLISPNFAPPQHVDEAFKKLPTYTDEELEEAYKKNLHTVQDR